MIWNKTNCAFCHAAALCSDKTKLLINYCGSQRSKNQPKITDALTECLANRGLNYLSIKLNGTSLTDRRNDPVPALVAGTP